MTRLRSGHVLKLEDGSFFIEEAPYRSARLEDAELYFKYFDLMEAQARAKQRTGMDSSFHRVAFRIVLENEG